MGFSVYEVIDCSAELVWAVVTDWGKARYWLGVQNLRPLEKGPVGKGSRLMFTARGAPQASTITEWVPQRALTLESTQGGITAVYAYTFEEQEGRTYVQLDGECTAQGRFWKLLLPIVSFAMARADAGQLKALKRLTEAMVAAAERKADELEQQQE